MTILADVSSPPPAATSKARSPHSSIVVYLMARLAEWRNDRVLARQLDRLDDFRLADIGLVRKVRITWAPNAAGFEPTARICPHYQKSARP